MQDEDLRSLRGHRDDLASLRDLLESSSYTGVAICRALGIQGQPHQLLTNTALCALMYYDQDRAGESPLHALGTMFGLGGWLPKGAYARLFSPEVRTLLERYNLVEGASADYQRSTVTVIEHEGRFFLSDRILERSPDDIRLTQEGRDHVDPPNYSSASIFFNPLDPVAGGGGRFLDVGSGNGSQAIFAAPGFDEVVGLDVAERGILFSSLNAALNRLDIEFVQRDCLQFEDARPFDRIVFNVPSIPKYQKDLIKVDTYTSELGYGLAIDFVNGRLRSLLAAGGVFRMWSVFAIRAGEGGIEGILRRELQDFLEYDVDITIERTSPFGLTEKEIQGRRLPRGSFLLADPSHAKIYLEFIGRSRIERIAPALVSLRWKTGPNPSVRTREVESFVPLDP